MASAGTHFVLQGGQRHVLHDTRRQQLEEAADLARAVMTMSRWRRSMPSTIRRAHSSTVIASSSFSPLKPAASPRAL
jgi:hypothetical protein